MEPVSRCEFLVVDHGDLLLFVCQTQSMQQQILKLTVIDGSGPSTFESEVARLLEDPDGTAAWEQLKEGLHNPRRSVS